MLFNYFQLYANQANTATDVQSNTTDSAKSVKNSVTFARSSVERRANMKAATTFFLLMYTYTTGIFDAAR